MPGTRSSPRKRKAEPDSTPSPRAKRQALSGLPNRPTDSKRVSGRSERTYISENAEAGVIAKPEILEAIAVPERGDEAVAKIKKSRVTVTEEEHQDRPKTRKRKTKEEKEAEAMPLTARSVGLRMYVGAHVSIAKGVENAITNCLHVGGNAFALFLQSQRKWDNKALADENKDAFIALCKEHKYDAMKHVLPHGSYLVNLAQEEQDKAKQAYDHFVDDLHRCEALGIRLYNFHPGAAGKDLESSIGRVAKQLNSALSVTNSVVPVLENMAGSAIGSRFSDLHDIISLIKPEFQSRIGVCIDTCHAFAAGYDLRTPEAFRKTMDEFDKVVGIKYLRALHINDSKAPLGASRDLHQNIGLGFLGLRAFHNVMNEPRFEDLPLILETPCEKPDPNDPTGKKMIEDKDIWAREIKLLESLIGMDAEGAEFKNLEKELGERGKAEREKMLKSIDAKNEKQRKKSDKAREKGQRNLKDMLGGKKGKNTEGSASSDDGEVE